MLEKVGLIGHLALGRDKYDGQTVKTRTVYYGLKKQLGEGIVIVDTYQKSNPFQLVVQTIKCLLHTEKIIVMLSRNGLRILLPILYCYVRWHHGEVYHCVIGGNDDELLKKNPKWVKYLSSFRVNWYESENLAAEMRKKGIHSAKYLPNFKNISPLSSEELSIQEKNICDSSEYRFCTFSRVTKEKGITNAIVAVEVISKEKGVNVKLDIYGPVEENYQTEFNELLRKTNVVEYKGIVASDESVSVLKNYYGLLFPTYFYGEGFPGTLIDAMCAGVPVIASDWHFNAEIISDGTDGIIYGNEVYPTLFDAVVWSIEHRSRFMQYRTSFWKKADNFSVKKNIDIILAEMKVRVEL